MKNILFALFIVFVSLNFVQHRSFAEDVMTSTREVLARVRSVLRRGERPAGNDGSSTQHERLRFDGWIIDLTTHTLYDPQGVAVELTSGEFKLLDVFVKHANRVLSREQLMDLVYAHDAPAFDRSIDVRIGRLRKRISVDPTSVRLIKTVRNGGYMFAAKVARV